jgi:predicted CXXCH cytochrome family protein
MMGSTSVTGYHHADDTGPVVNSAAQGWYRFLAGHMSGDGHGASGIEDNDWQFTYGTDDHNEYLGWSGAKTSSGSLSSLGDTMSGYCCGCHGNFHLEQDGGVWVRHPSDVVIRNTGEYADAFNAVAGIGTYDPQVPVARPDLTGWVAASGEVTLDTDLVMCLSCHRPHGSPYPDMLRWDYHDMEVGDSTKSGGCFSCHTQKRL